MEGTLFVILSIAVVCVAAGVIWSMVRVDSWHKQEMVILDEMMRHMQWIDDDADENRALLKRITEDLYGKEEKA